MHRRLLKSVVALCAIALLITTAAGTAGSLRHGKAQADSYKQAGSYNVGIIYSRTGAFSAYGAEYISGLKLGLSYATKGTNKVNGKTIDLTVVDDGTDATKGVAAAKDLIGKGYK